jgi:hypothetical protein
MKMFTIANAMSLIAALPELVILIKDLMAHAQNDMGAGTGSNKKAAVLNGVQAIVADPSLWQDIQGIVSHLIDFFAKFKVKPAP